MHLRRLLAAAAAAAAVSIGGFATVPTAGAAGKNPNVFRFTWAFGEGPAGASSGCYHLITRASTFSNIGSEVDANAPNFAFALSVADPSNPPNCLYYEGTAASATVTQNQDTNLFTLTADVNVYDSGSNSTTTEPVTVSFQGLGAALQVQFPPAGSGFPLLVGHLTERECVSTVTFGGETYSTFSADNSLCDLVSGVGTPDIPIP